MCTIRSALKLKVVLRFCSLPHFFGGMATWPCCTACAHPSLSLHGPEKGHETWVENIPVYEVRPEYKLQ